MRALAFREPIFKRRQVKHTQAVTAVHHTDHCPSPVPLYVLGDLPLLQLMLILPSEKQPRQICHEKEVLSLNVQ